LELRFEGSLEVEKSDCKGGREEAVFAAAATEIAESLGRLVMVVAVASIEVSVAKGVSKGLCG
jgi:hypothetical protein